MRGWGGLSVITLHGVYQLAARSRRGMRRITKLRRKLERLEADGNYT